MIKDLSCLECGKELNGGEKDTCESCQCEHAEHDHGICIDCGSDRMEHLIAQAEFERDSREGR